MLVRKQVIMKVISIKEPFATLIKDGIKIYETRSWKTNYRGEIYIHASKLNEWYACYHYTMYFESACLLEEMVI